MYLNLLLIFQDREALPQFVETSKMATADLAARVDFTTQVSTVLRYSIGKTLGYLILISLYIIIIPSHCKIASNCTYIFVPYKFM